MSTRRRRPAKRRRAKTAPAPGVPRPLTPKQERFAQEYLLDLNATQAAIRAGYSKRHADTAGPRLSGNVGIGLRIRELMAERAKRVGISQDRVLKELELMAFSSITHYAIGDEGQFNEAAEAPDGCIRAVSSVKHRVTTHGTGKDKSVTREVEFRLWDKPGQVKLAGQHVGLFKDTLGVKLDAEVKVADRAAMAEEIRHYDTETIIALDELRKQQDAILANAKGKSGT